MVSNLLQERWLRLAFADDSTTVLVEKKKDDPCWDNYEMVGTKEKDGKEVPNCVPEGDEALEEADENAFVAKAAEAKAKGEDSFKMGDKEYDVTIDKETAEEITGDTIEEAAVRAMVRMILMEAVYDGRKVDLNKPMSNPENPNKKSKVYVNSGEKYKTGEHKGQIKAKKVQFGQPGVRIKKDNPEARKSFRARHKCDQDKPKDSAGYWSCKAW